MSSGTGDQGGAKAGAPSLLALCTRRARGRLRRHRHQPALRPQGVLRARVRHRPHRRERAGRALADLLVAHFVVSFKYLTFIMRADNRGEGGIMALLALLHPRRPGITAPAPCCWGARALRRGAALRRRRDHAGDLGAGRRRGHRRGDARTVGALRGSPSPPCILVALFLFQRRGTARVGAVFGPVMIIWFLAIAALGVHGILQHPRVLAAVNPWYARAASSLRDGLRGFLVLGVGGAGGDRRRGALRRHGALRPPPDPAGLVRRGAPRAGAQLLRAGRPAGSESGGGPQPVLRAGARRGRSTRWSRWPRRPR